MTNVMQKAYITSLTNSACTFGIGNKYQETTIGNGQFVTTHVILLFSPFHFFLFCCAHRLLLSVQENSLQYDLPTANPALFACNGSPSIGQRYLPDLEENASDILSLCFLRAKKKEKR